MPERGEELRAILDISDTSPLKNRDLRNHFEHFDVRLEQWATMSKKRLYIDTNIGPIREMNFAGDKPMRHFDSETLTIHFQGDSLALIPLKRELESIIVRSKVAH